MRDDDALEFLSDHFPCVANLLRVAGAADVVYQDWAGATPTSDLAESWGGMRELREALKEVEHLL